MTGVTEPLLPELPIRSLENKNNNSPISSGHTLLHFDMTNRGNAPTGSPNKQTHTVRGHALKISSDK